MYLDFYSYLQIIESCAKAILKIYLHKNKKRKCYKVERDFTFILHVVF